MPTKPPPPPQGSAAGDARWRGRPVLAGALRLGVFLLPIAVATATSISLVRLLPAPSDATSTVLRILTSFGVSTLVLLVVDRLARRLLPLAVLLQLSLAFPDTAPSRLKLARAASSVRKLEETAKRARAEGIDDDPARAAEQILSLIAAVEGHDRGTRGHSERVRLYTDLIARQLRLPPADEDRLRWAALLHDVGKLMVPGALLNKPSKLEPGEWEIVKRHPEDGARLVQPLRAWLGEWASAVEEHHERYDGAGYPRGLAGMQISRGGRIVAVADAYETMTARRAYRKPLRAEQARQELVRCSGSQFDPAIVRAFLEISLGRLSLVSGPLSWLAQMPFLRGIEQATSAAGALAVGGAALVLGTPPGPPAARRPPAVVARADTEAAVAPESVKRVASTSTDAPRAGAPAPQPSPSPSPSPTRTKGPGDREDPIIPDPSPPPSPSPEPSPPLLPLPSAVAEPVF